MCGGSKLWVSIKFQAIGARGEGKTLLVCAVVGALGTQWLDAATRSATREGLLSAGLL